MPAFDDPQTEARHSTPLVIAHRGASGLAPENTLAAFSLAIALGADGVELDVQMSRDGLPVVIHDTRVNRTTNTKGSVSRLTLNQLQRLDAGSWFERRLSRRPRVRAMVGRISSEVGAAVPRYSGEPVPSLEDVLSLLKPAGLERIYIELKGSPLNHALLESILALVRKHGVDRSATLLIRSCHYSTSERPGGRLTHRSIVSGAGAQTNLDSFNNSIRRERERRRGSVALRACDTAEYRRVSRARFGRFGMDR